MPCLHFEQGVTVSYEGILKRVDCKQHSTEATELGTDCKACLKSKFRKLICAEFFAAEPILIAVFD